LTLVDTNILLDLVTNDEKFADWSMEQLETASLNGPLYINDIIYSELSVGYETKEALDEFISGIGLKLEPLPSEALFLAGKVFVKYKKAGGTKNGVLLDFFIGAHAAVLDIPLLTRDVARYKTYYPILQLITL
jgi:predicted nucleic acid-binding protein